MAHGAATLPRQLESPFRIDHPGDNVLNAPLIVGSFPD
jgi:hypothetical protein